MDFSKDQTPLSLQETARLVSLFQQGHKLEALCKALKRGPDVLLITLQKKGQLALGGQTYHKVQTRPWVALETVEWLRKQAQESGRDKS